MRHRPFYETVLLVALAILFSGCSCSGVSSQNNYADNIRDLGGKAELKIDFSKSDITDADLEGMDFPDTLVEINLSNTDITDDGVAELKRANNLNSVILAHTQITEKSIDHLKEMPNLRSANIANKSIPFESIMKFTKHLNTKRPTEKQLDAYETGVYGPPPDED